MPRKKQPQSLRSSSLRALARYILNSCEKSYGRQDEVIQHYVKDIPNTFANEYVDEVLQLSSRRNYFLDVTRALHPKCTEISKKGESEFFSWPDQMLRGLYVMRDLISVEPVIALRYAWKGTLRYFPFPRMINLRSVNVSLGTGTNPQILLHITENCPRLEHVVIHLASQDGAMPSTLPCLSKSKKLKRIFVPFITSDVAMHLLDHLPNLEVLQMTCIGEVIPLCKRTYKLKDFVAQLKVREDESVQKIVTHFPNLEKLALGAFDNAPVNMISELPNLKSLALFNGASSNLLFLKDKSLFGLHQLHLEGVTGLDSLFSQNMNVSCPKLESLTITMCTGINVAGIIEIFPNLKFLQLFDGEFVAHSRPCKVTHAGSEALEYLEMKNVPTQQMRYLIPLCSKLKSLKVCITSVKSCVHELLCNASLKELRTLYVDDSSMKREVIPIILDSCGDCLERVDLHSSELMLTPDYVLELSNQLRKYDMTFCINGTSVII